MKLRIISGTCKGRLINVPKSKRVRPTTDKVRESLLNILNNKIPFDGIKVLDLYSGSGSLGLECYSRSAEKIHFVEQNYVMYKTLQDNINELNAQNACKIFKTSAVKFSALNAETIYDLILADPPFFKDDIYTVTENLIINKFLEKNGLLIIERSIQTKEKDINNFRTEPFRVIGDTCLYEMKY